MISSGNIMKRDMDLIRAILLTIESNPSGFARQPIEIDGYTQEEIGYHAILLGEAGLAKVVNLTSHGSKSPEAIITQLTWAGHEFLDSARENQRWNQAKDLINKVDGASMQIWVAVLAEIAKKAPRSLVSIASLSVSPILATNQSSVKPTTKYK